MAAPRPHVLTLERTGATVAPHLVLADTPWRRMRGLLGRGGLEAGHGMHFRSNSVHTFGMRFAIDVAYLDRDGRVLKCVHALEPWRVSGTRGATVAVELAAGVLETHGVRRGDTLRLDTAIPALGRAS